MIYGREYDPIPKFAGRCECCGEPIEVGERVWVCPNGIDMYHEDCMESNWTEIIREFDWKTDTAEQEEPDV